MVNVHVNILSKDYVSLVIEGGQPLFVKCPGVREKYIGIGKLIYEKKKSDVDLSEKIEEYAKRKIAKVLSVYTQNLDPGTIAKALVGEKSTVVSSREAFDKLWQS